MPSITALAALLGSVLVPGTLAVSSLLIAPRVGFRNVFSPKILWKRLCEGSGQGGTHPLSALCVALAGTLGVGNITGVASALMSGGPGALFWMWIGALIVLPVKYLEVRLAVFCRRWDKSGYYGGAMYVLRDGLTGQLSPKTAGAAGGGFAVLCCVNSLLTGNIVQANAAASVIAPDRRLLCGCFLALLVFVSVILGTRKIERIASCVIPALTGFYILACGIVILPNLRLIPWILRTVVLSALCPRAALGAAMGFTARQAIRYGIMRGIFSNEAGCGTSPTAHAAADTRSPDHQASLGVAEVVFDTLILCTMTGLVLLVADVRWGVLPWQASADAAAVTAEAFAKGAGAFIASLVRLSVPLFAYSSIIAQFYYGMTAIRYLTKKKTAAIFYGLASSVCPVIGAVIPSGAMWLGADLLLGSMTLLNCSVLVFLSSRAKWAGNPR
ncbi:MAG: sodium:alanine symporter family protein [Clostridia bacterium]|nr:sodium:alanine symporter family protein [Clostridia bacterium]